MVIAERLLRAFQDVRAEQPTTIASGTEAEINALMESRLNSLIDEDVFWSQLVLCVARGKESLRFDGSHLEKRPDLSIYLTSASRAFPLIAEAKIMDSAAAKTEILYCDTGIRRFIDGEYAWGNREGLMLGYVRDHGSIAKRLTPVLLKASKETPPGYLIEALPVQVELTGSDLAYSQHGRAFTYIHQKAPQNLPGSIAIWHLWLS
ncbi:MAG: hypothetical protein ACTHLR_06105 [Rhizomicrobium sp.]